MKTTQCIFCMYHMPINTLPIFFRENSSPPFCPYSFRKKSLRPPIFFQKKSSPPCRWSRPGVNNRPVEQNTNVGNGKGLPGLYNRYADLKSPESKFE